MASVAENARDRTRSVTRPGFGVVMGGRTSVERPAQPAAPVRESAGGYQQMGDEPPRQEERYAPRNGSSGQRAGSYRDARGVGSERYGEREQSGAAAQQEQRGAAQRDSRQSDGQREFHSVHVYGGKAALCFSADETRGQGHTVRVEAAPSKGQRAYDWGEKISLQFTVKELPKVLCVLMSWIPSVDFQAHGVANDKAISLTNQDGGKVFVNLRQTRTARAVPVTAEDVFGIVDLVIKQMLKNSPHLTADALLAMTRAMAVRFKGG